MTEDTLWEHPATVTISTALHVTLRGAGPHPDLVDWEEAALALDRRIEERGSVPADVEVMHCTVHSETEPW
jgi:hypothetical protein